MVIEIEKSGQKGFKIVSSSMQGHEIWKIGY